MDMCPPVSSRQEENGGLRQLRGQMLRRSQLPQTSGSSCRPPLSPEAELRNKRAITLEIVPLEVVQEPPTLPHQHQETAPRMVILLVRLQMRRKVVDSACEQRDLHLRRARVGRGSAVLV